MSDIVERLRERHWRAASETNDDARNRRQREREEGADEIARLTARVAELEAICNQLEAEALDYAIQNKELRDAGQEVLHLSDRKHAAWDRLRAAITKGEREG